MEKSLFYPSFPFPYPLVKGKERGLEKGKISDTSLKQIVELAYDMNKKGKRRKLTKEEYLHIFEDEAN